MTETWIELASGPLFRISLAVCLLGLAYRLGTMLWLLRSAYKRAGDKQIPRQTVVRATLNWLLPLRVLRARPLYGLASFVFHVGILAVPLFSVGHVALWAGTATFWPTLSPGAADVLTWLAIGGLVVVMAERFFVAQSRDLTTRSDVFLLVLLLLLTVSGYLAAHPASAPFSPRVMLVLHMLMGNLALILTPMSKIVHCVLMPLSQLIGEIGWRFPAESGRHVTVALAKENEPI